MPLLLWFARAGAALAVVALMVVMIGPFQGAEERVGVSDGVAHALAFGFITGALLLNVPRATRLQAALLALAIGVGVEFAQALSGRDADWRDVVADTVGILAVALAWFTRRPW
jgi:VanZ family protein